jgi:hypothetical protein
MLSEIIRIHRANGESDREIRDCVNNQIKSLEESGYDSEIITAIRNNTHFVSSEKDADVNLANEKEDFLLI